MYALLHVTYHICDYNNNYNYHNPAAIINMIVVYIYDTTIHMDGFCDKDPARVQPW